MTPEFIRWGISGYISLLLFQLARPIRNTSGWDFVAQTSIFALINFTFSKLFLSSINFYTPLFVTTLNLYLTRLFPFEDSLHFFIGMASSPFVGIAMGKIWFRFHNKVSYLSTWLSGRERSLEFYDPFFATCNSLLSNVILITLTSGKVYVGVLVSATDDPNESQRFINIVPIMSGHRKTDTSNVKFDTDYIRPEEYASSDIPSRELLIAFNQVSTMAKFDLELHNWFVKTRRTEIAYQNEIDLN